MLPLDRSAIHNSGGATSSTPSMSPTANPVSETMTSRTLATLVMSGLTIDQGSANATAISGARTEASPSGIGAVAKLPVAPSATRRTTATAMP